MLGMVPKDVPSTTGEPVVAFVDLAARFFVYGVHNRTAIQDLETLRSLTPIGGLIANCPACKWASYFHGSGSTRQSVGFEWFLDVDAVITFGQQPSLGLVVKGRFEAESIARALQARGFAVTTISGVEVWYRFDDYEALKDRDKFDPFWGYVGSSARITLVGDCLLASQTWPSIEAMLSAYKGKQPSLLDDPALQALAQTVTMRPRLLTQALFYRWNDLQPQREHAREFCKRMGITFEPALPPFQLAVLADIQLGQLEEDRDQIFLIGLFYPNPLDASKAADVLANRVARYTAPLRTGRTSGSFVEEYGGTVSSYVLNLFLAEGAVAIVEVRYPVPKPPEWWIALPIPSGLLELFVIGIITDDCWFFW